MFIYISPESFYWYFYLSNCEHTVLECTSLDWGNVYLKVLNITCKWELSMYPVWMSHCVYVFKQFWIFIWFEIESWFKNISSSLLRFVVSVEDIWFCCFKETSSHEFKLYEILNFFHVWDKVFSMFFYKFCNSFIYFFSNFFSIFDTFMLHLLEAFIYCLSYLVFIKRHKLPRTFFNIFNTHYFAILWDYILTKKKNYG